MATASFFFGYLDHINTIQGFELLGDAEVCGDGCLSLTKQNCLHSAGAVLNSRIIKFADTDGQLKFDTIITFKIDSAAPTTNGIFFFIAPPFASGGSLAIFDPSTGNSENLFAVRFSTYDGRLCIDFGVESRDSRNPTDYNDCLGKKVTAIISYRDRKVSVVAVNLIDGETVRASYDVDLKSVLNQYVQFAIYAFSGDSVENHYVYSWSFDAALVRDEISGGSRQ